MLARVFACCVVLSALVALISACSPAASHCKEGTVLLTVTLVETAVSADTLDVAVSLGNNGAVSTSIVHKAGVATGTIEIDFPSGYPRTETANIRVQALAQGAVVATGATSVLLDDNCEAAQLTLSSAIFDLASVDLVGRDLAGVDLAEPDLSGSGVLDLAGFKPDLAGCKPTTEQCFNGLDDDCDGLVDCSDPDCAAITECVPAETGIVYGTSIATGTCPAMTKSAIQLASYSAPTPTCAGCSCTATEGCSIPLYAGAASCTASTTLVANVTSTCVNFPAALPTYFTFGNYVANGTCSNAGTPALPSVVIGGTHTFCGATVGGGCAGAYVCAPKSATPPCVLYTGAVTCPAAYPTAYQGGTSYTEGRSCSACSACSVTKQGTCSNTDSPPSLWTSKDCVANDGTWGPGNYCIGGGQMSANISPIAAAASPTCSSPTSNVDGSITTVGAHTVCCE